MHMHSSRDVVAERGIKRTALCFTAAYHALARERPTSFGHDRVLPFCVLVVVEIHDHPVPYAPELVRSCGVGGTGR